MIWITEEGLEISGTGVALVNCGLQLFGITGLKSVGRTCIFLVLDLPGNLFKNVWL